MAIIFVSEGGNFVTCEEKKRGGVTKLHVFVTFVLFSFSVILFLCSVLSRALTMK